MAGPTVSAARALGSIGDPRAIESLIRALGDKHGLVPPAAAVSLGRMGKPAVEPLTQVLRDKTSPNRPFAAYALAKIQKK